MSDAGSAGGFSDILQKFHAREKAGNKLDLNNFKGTSSLAGWFLGPLAENEEAMTRMVAQAVKANSDARREYAAQFGDPPYVTDAIRNADDYKATMATFEKNLTDMLAHLHGSIPLSSYRNQSHMYWDCTLPGFVGYFAAMLYNQNNVAAEASPVTTLLEIEVGKDLARMLGYDVPEDEKAPGAVVPWAHITCDGSVANAESIWAARNLKYLPIALAAAIREMPALSGAKHATVGLATGGRKELLSLDTWTLLNLPIDEVIGLSPRLIEDYGVKKDDIKTALDTYSVQSLGLAEFQRRFVSDEVPNLPIILAPSTAHYSWPKGAALIGLGANHLERIHVDLDGRMDTTLLRKKLQECLDNKTPVLEVVAVIGSTEESAVDPLAEIVEIREEFRQQGMEFTLHVDGAWGGYFASILRKANRPVHEYQDGATEHTPAMVMSDYVMRQYRAFAHADTQTVDPHKAGFIPYPAGALCYRNGGMRDLIAFTAPVVYHGGIDPTVGVYGIEGSKPGAAAAGVYLSHSIIRPDESGYGKLLGKCIFNSKRLYAGVVSMAKEDDIVRAVPFQRLPAEKQGKTREEVEAQIDYIRKHFVPPENDDLVKFLAEDEDALELFRELGSDQNIITYALNFRTSDGWNSDVELMNDLTERVYRALSISEYDGGKVPSEPMFVTSSSFEVADYGQAFVNEFGRRAGVSPTKGVGIKFLVSTTQDPWVTATEKGNFLPYIVDALKTTTITAALDLMKCEGITPPNPYS